MEKAVATHALTRAATARATRLPRAGTTAGRAHALRPPAADSMTRLAYLWFARRAACARRAALFFFRRFFRSAARIAARLLIDRRVRL